MAWEIRYGLGGGFGGLQFRDWEPSDALDESDALEQAYTLACDEYDSYAGLHGLRTVEEIMEEEGYDLSEAEDAYHEERESWLDYEAREVK